MNRDGRWQEGRRPLVDEENGRARGPHSEVELDIRAVQRWQDEGGRPAAAATATAVDPGPAHSYRW